MINEIIWGKYYTDSCSATIIILNNVATPKNCTITRLQCYFKTVYRLNISLEQCLLVPNDCLQSLRHRTDEILHSGQSIWSPRFPKMTFECHTHLRLWAGINRCSHNVPNIFNRRQIWQIWRSISWWNVMSYVVFQPTDCGLWCVCMSTFLKQIC